MNSDGVARERAPARIPKELSNASIPKHICIIMDGNGRWARQRSKLRIFGHNKGADTVDTITEECARLGVKQLTVYAFSSENWKRPKREVEQLMKLLKSFLLDKRPKIMRNNIRLTTIGRTNDLPEDVRAELNRSIEASSTNTGMNLCLALSYGGRVEIVDACRRFARDVADGLRKPEDLDERLLQAYMYDPKMEPPDLLIRTGGDMRISNFLLWHISYTELHVTPVLWPDFSVKDLYAAILDYSKRERRFGEVRDS
jgi:undecaprenyl diphosphate synthase